MFGKCFKKKHSSLLQTHFLSKEKPFVKMKDDPRVAQEREGKNEKFKLKDFCRDKYLFNWCQIF